MKRYSALMQDTWWAWLIIMAFGIVGGILVSKIFYSAIPICIFSFFYFGLMRYDENGNCKEDVGSSANARNEEQGKSNVGK